MVGFLFIKVFIVMDYIISENKLSNVLSKYLNLSFDGFDNLDYNWADFDCGWGVCCDIYAIGFVLPGREHDDYLFKLVDGENYDSGGDYPEELKCELPEPCYDLPNPQESRFNTIVIGAELFDRIEDMFGNMMIWEESFLKMINQMYGINATKIDMDFY
jgi:hypothetical protein